MTNEEALDIIELVKELTENDITVVYPLVSYMCRNGYVSNWECVGDDDDFYIDGIFIV